MRLTEHEGKALFKTFGIPVPHSELIAPEVAQVSLPFPLMLKSQVLVGDRKKKGGIVNVATGDEFTKKTNELFALPIDGELPKVLLAEEVVAFVEELYVSFSYSSDARGPVLALNKSGGSGVHDAMLAPIDIVSGCDDAFVKGALLRANVASSEALCNTIKNLWRLFYEESLILAEINPLFVLADGSVIAGDAKVVRDDALVEGVARPFISLGGDIAIIASGGGASMLNIDILMRAGGKPANYVEYSGNPPASVVEELTLKVLGQPGIRGVWVVGGTANFTDIYETMSGFVAGLRRLVPKPIYPIVIRRDGPRQAEAKVMLEKFAKEEGYQMKIFGPELSMSESARKLLEMMK